MFTINGQNFSREEIVRNLNADYRHGRIPASGGFRVGIYADYGGPKGERRRWAELQTSVYQTYPSGSGSSSWERVAFSHPAIKADEVPIPLPEDVDYGPALFHAVAARLQELDARLLFAGSAGEEASGGSGDHAESAEYL